MPTAPAQPCTPCGGPQPRPRLAQLASRAAALLLVLVGLAGCTPELPMPVLSSVNPGWGYNGEETVVDVVGAGFYPVVQVDSNNRSDIDDGFEIWVESDPRVELFDVALEDHTHLGARVPAGIAAGTYGVTVVSPSGVESSLDPAFEVRNTRGDELLVTTSQDQTEWQVGDFASLTVELLDPSGERVNEDVLVEVTVAEDLADIASFEEDTLADQLTLPDGSGITGRLGPDGRGVVGVTTTQPLEQLRVSFVVADADSPVQGDSIDLSFVAGTAAGLEIQLPSSVFEAVAGESFEVLLQVVDVDGNAVDDATGEFVLIESCSGGSFVGTVSFSDGSEAATVTFTQATGGGCVESTVYAVGFIDGAPIEAESEGFAVLPAEAQGLAIEVDPLEITAGDQVLADIQAIDEFGNAVTDIEDTVSVLVSIDGASAVSPADQDCNPLDDGDAYCLVQLNSAGDEVVMLISTSGPDPLTGVSEPFTVLAGPAVALDVSLDRTEAVAGEPFTLSVLAIDELGNGVELDVEGGDPVLVSDITGDVSCASAGGGAPPGTELFDCSATQATDSLVLDVELPTQGLAGETDAISVVNGPLSLVYIDLAGETEVVAGDELAVQLRGTDAWDNPYLVQDDPVVDLADLSGDVSPASVALSSEGTASVDLQVTVAREDDRVLASQDGVELGASELFDVLPGDAVELVMTAPQTWVWMDASITLTVEAQDAWGNTATDYAEVLTVSSSGDLADTRLLSDMVAGVGTLEWTYHSRGLEDLVTATDGSMSAVLSLDALDIGCTDPPTAELTVADETAALLCIIDSWGRTATVTVDAGHSSTGGASLAAWHFNDGEDNWVRSTSDSLVTSWEEAGRWELQLVLADADACADLALADVYVGADDGSAVGPVELSLDEAVLYTEGSSKYADETTVTVSARTCTEDAAADATVELRVDLGELDPDTVDSTGSGLGLVLGSDGSGTASWSMAGSLFAGTGTLYAGVATGQAYGSVSVAVEGDLQPPHLLSMDPSGSFAGDFDSIELQFSEELLASAVQADALALTDPDGIAVELIDDDLELSTDLRSLILWLPDTVSGSDGAWLFELHATPRDSLRDLEGNIIDGSWTGDASSFAIELGDVANDAPDITACTWAIDGFRPDGDDGSGDEADTLDVDVEADATPAWWRLRVVDAQGDLVHQEWIPEGASDTAGLSWDGRDLRGRITANGSYDLTIVAADEHWNTGEGCTSQVAIDNRVAPLE